MPIYSYKCSKCGKIIDKLEKAGENGNGKIVCDDCNADAFRIFSPVGIIFKGSGFYSTDYKSSTKGTSGVSSSSKAPSVKSTDEGSKSKEKESKVKS